MDKVLVIRNDKIGDFMLAWPSFALLKQSMPNTKIYALVPHYTKEMAELCPWIDEVIIDNGKKSSAAFSQLVTTIRAEKFAAAIALFSNSYNGKLVWKAKIKYRLAPATKLAQFYYNHRLKQRRSLSKKPEYRYNLDLIYYFLEQQKIHPANINTPYLTFTDAQISEQRAKLATSLNCNLNRPWCFLHAGSGGSANNLDLNQYAQLVKALALKYPKFEFILTAGPGEKEQAIKLKQLLNLDSCYIYSENDGLDDFTLSIATASLFIAGSTGPLHIAGALNIPTIGFYPSKRSATPLRWQTLNDESRRIAFAPKATKETQDDLQSIEIDSIIEPIFSWAAQFEF